MVKNKILGIPMTLFVLGLLIVGGVTAAVITQLSNTATVDVTLDSALKVMMSKSNSPYDWQETIVLGGAVAGSPVTYYYNLTNRANATVTAKYNITISNKDITCASLDSVVLQGSEVMGSCVDATESVTFVMGGRTFFPYDEKLETMTITFDLLAVPGAYKITTNLIPI